MLHDLEDVFHFTANGRLAMIDLVHPISFGGWTRFPLGSKRLDIRHPFLPWDDFIHDLQKFFSFLVLRFLAPHSTSPMVCCFLFMHRLCLIPMPAVTASTYHDLISVFIVIPFKGLILHTFNIILHTGIVAVVNITEHCIILHAIPLPG